METYKKINQINTNCGNCVVAKEKKERKGLKPGQRSLNKRQNKAEVVCNPAVDGFITLIMQLQSHSLSRFPALCMPNEGNCPSQKRRACKEIYLCCFHLVGKSKLSWTSQQKWKQRPRDQIMRFFSIAGGFKETGGHHVGSVVTKSKSTNELCTIVLF